MKWANPLTWISAAQEAFGSQPTAAQEEEDEMADAQGAFVTRAFERLLKDSYGRKYQKLHQALKAYLDRPKGDLLILSSSAVPPPDVALGAAGGDGNGVSLEPPQRSTSGTHPNAAKAPNVTAAAVMAEAGHSLEGIEADIILLPIRLAIETKQSKLMETALDCLHKLIAYGHLEGDCGLEGGRNNEMHVQLFQLVCNCADNTAVDSVVLQVIKVLLTAVASNTFQVHGDCLILALRTCYNIVLNSKSGVNVATAKGTLTQMISIVFKRMEDSADTRGARPQAYPEPKPPTQSSQQANGSGEEEDTDDEEGEGSVSNGLPVSAGPAETAAAAADTAAAAAESDSSEAAGPQGSATGALEGTPTGDASAATVNATPNLAELEAALDRAVRPAGSETQPSQGVDLETLVVGQRDALLVFRTLCKMAMKEGTEDIVLRSRILSLELLQALLESVSNEFTVNYEFLDTVKMHLCYALVRACVSPDEKVFRAACAIFATLIRRFRPSLKAEIGLFFPLVVLRPLDSTDIPLPSRVAALSMVEGMTQDAQLLADVFVNYDCDLDGSNLFEHMVSSLARVAQGPSGAAEAGTPHMLLSTVKTSALQALVNVVQVLERWHSKDKPSAATTSDAAAAEAAAARDSTGAESADGSVDGSEDGVNQADQFGKLKEKKSLLEAAVFQFNMKPEKGLKLLESHGIVKREPQAVAEFLLRTVGLNKTAVGDYLGQHDTFQLSVMHAYVDAMDFKGAKFDAAIRKFLQGFRLPGEAQKIDRIMEKFAEKYCRDNPGIFKAADTAYVLAYAVIMLNTDAHNPVVAAKMQKQDFVRMNSGTTSATGEVEEGAPVAMLEEIYDSIVSNEIKLKDDDALPKGKGKGRSGGDERGQLVSVLNLAAPKRKSPADLKAESMEIVRRTQALVRRGKVKKQRGVFHSALHADLTRPMLEVVGWPLVATLSMTMEDADAMLKPRVQLCMEGLRRGIHLAYLLGMETLRYAFLTSLVRFTFLHAPKEMRMKNVEAIRTLLVIAEQEPQALQDTWNAVLECVSRLDNIVNTPALAASLMSMNNQVSREVLLHALQELAAKPSEQVFVASSSLPSDAIVEFFTALCGVSAEELKHIPARVFSLQKLVEISYYNMTRIRMVWARIWSVLSLHFIAAGQHPDEQIAMYAIDSIRQLALKYLERAELANFKFQNDILKPFVVVMRRSKNERIRELILQCVVQMIQMKVTNIKSGWRSVFMVFTTAASDSYEPVVDLAFNNVEQVVLEHFEQVVGDCFMDCVNCLMAFSNNPASPAISLKAIALLRICEDRLAEGTIPGGAIRPISEGEKLSDSEVSEYYWFPMLAGLSDLTSDPRPKIRACAVEVLFDLLKERGHKFSPRFWESIFDRVLFPIFDYVRHAGTDGEKPGPADLWLRDTSVHCLHLLCDLFCSFYEEVAFTLPSLLGLLLDCATRPDQSLAAIAVGALLRLVDSGAPLFGDKDWGIILDSLRLACLTTRPLELLHLENDEAVAAALQQQRSGQLPSKILMGAEADVLVAFSNLSLKRSGEDGDEGRAEEREEDSSEEGQQQGDAVPSQQEALAAEAASAEGAEGLATASAAESEGREGDAKEQGEGEGAKAQEQAEETADAVAQRASEGAAAALGVDSLGKRLMDALLLKNVGVMRARSSSSSVHPEASPIALNDSAAVEEAAADAALEEELQRQREEAEAAAEAERELEIGHNTRVKCYVQLLILGALNQLQSKHWDRLGPLLQRQLVLCVAAGLEFATLYNNDHNLRQRLRDISTDRPPPCLLRQEVIGTQLYLIVLLRTLHDPAAARVPAPVTSQMVLRSGHAPAKMEDAPRGSAAKLREAVEERVALRRRDREREVVPEAEVRRIEDDAERELLDLCERVLRVSAVLQPNEGQPVEAEVHRSLALRAPVVATVLTALSLMDSHRFSRFASHLYPHCTRLICSDQMDVRKALGDLFRERLTPLVPPVVDTK